MVVIIINGDFISSHWNPTSLYLTSYKKKELKNKIDTEIKFMTTKGTNHITVKKDRRLK